MHIHIMWVHRIAPVLIVGNQKLTNLLRWVRCDANQFQAERQGEKNGLDIFPYGNVM
jgi:hypothetical protein